MKLGHDRPYSEYSAKRDDSTGLLILAIMGALISTMSNVSWPAVGATVGVLSLLTLIWVQIGRPLLRRWRMKSPYQVHFTIIPLQQVKLDHVLQDDRGHHVKELVLPSNMVVEIEIECLPKTSFYEQGCSTLFTNRCMRG